MRAQRDPDFGRQEASRARAFAEGLRWLADVTCSPPAITDSPHVRPMFTDEQMREKHEPSAVYRPEAFACEEIGPAPTDADLGEFPAVALILRCARAAREAREQGWDPEELLLINDDIRRVLEPLRGE
jgi:hypothetical protein